MDRRHSRKLVTRSAVAVALWVTLLVPAAARAGTLTLQVGRADGTGSLESCLPGTHFVDLFLTETGPNEDEGLFAYDLVFDIVGPPVSSGAVRLTGADRTPSNFVLGDDPSKSVFNIAQGPGLTNERHMVINANARDDGGSDPLFDIQSGQKAARIFYEVAPGTSVGQFRLVFDPNQTVFGSGDPNHPTLEIAVAAVDSGAITVCPEPGAMALAGLATLLALRRRRRPAGV